MGSLGRNISGFKGLEQAAIRYNKFRKLKRG